MNGIIDIIANGSISNNFLEKLYGFSFKVECDNGEINMLKHLQKYSFKASAFSKSIFYQSRSISK